MQWQKNTNVFWHNNHAYFSLMSQVGVFQPYRGRAGLSNHQMCPILARSIYLMDFLNTCLHVSDDAHMTPLSLRVALVCRQFSWSHGIGLGKEFSTGNILHGTAAEWNSLSATMWIHGVSPFYLTSAKLANWAAFFFSTQSWKMSL